MGSVPLKGDLLFVYQWLPSLGQNWSTKSCLEKVRMFTLSFLFGKNYKSLLGRSIIHKQNVFIHNVLLAYYEGEFMFVNKDFLDLCQDLPPNQFRSVFASLGQAIIQNLFQDPWIQ